MIWASIRRKLRERTGLLPASSIAAPGSPFTATMRGLRGVAVVLNDVGQLSLKDFFIIEFEVHATQIVPLTNRC